MWAQIHLPRFCVSHSRMITMKYDLSTDGWAEFKRIDFQPNGHGCTTIVAKNKLFNLYNNIELVFNNDRSAP